MSIIMSMIMIVIIIIIISSCVVIIIITITIIIIIIGGNLPRSSCIAAARGRRASGIGMIMFVTLCVLVLYMLYVRQTYVLLS